MAKKRLIFIISIIIAILLLYKSSQFIMSSYEQASISNHEQVDQTDQVDKIEEPETRTINILAAGDIMFHMPQVRAAYKGDGDYDFDDNFKYIKEYTQNADMAIVNYETITLGKNKSFSGFPRFNSPEQTLLAIKNAGFDIISTANNHSLDQGKAGIISNLKLAEKYGLKTVGTYLEPQSEYLIKEENGIKVGFLAYTYGLNGLEHSLTKEELSHMINLIEEEKIKNDIKTLKNDVDVLAIAIHWGEEYKRIPNGFQTDLAYKMVDWGANIILGSHPHVLQKSEIIKKNGKDNFIIYSMGNFISNQSESSMGNSFTEDGVMVDLEITKNIEDNETIIKNIEFIPTWRYKYNEAGKNSYRILPAKDVIDGKLDIAFSDRIMTRIKKSYKDSMEILNYKNGY